MSQLPNALFSHPGSWLLTLYVPYSMHAGKLVGQLIGNARNSWEERICTSPEPDSYLAKLNELWSSNANPKVDKAESYLLNDCLMLRYTFASQDLPCFDITSTSSISCQGSDISCTSDRRPNSNKKNLQISFSSLHKLCTTKQETHQGEYRKRKRK